MQARDTEIAGRAALWMTGLFGLATLPIPVINLFRSQPIELPLDLVVPYLFGTLASFMAYVYGRMEQSIAQQQRILNRPSQGIEVFHTSEEFLEKLIEITVGAEMVSTLNLSPARGEQVNLDVYFRQVHQSIKSRRSSLRSFRSIASLDSNRKLAFLLARAHELSQTGKVSLAVFDQDSVRSLSHPLSMHITVKHGKAAVFLFPPVDMTGAMDSVLIYNEAMARVLQDYFNTLWERSVRINEGTRIYLSGIEYLAGLDSDLRDDPHYQALKEIAR